MITTVISLYVRALNIQILMYRIQKLQVEAIQFANGPLGIPTSHAKQTLGVTSPIITSRYGTTRMPEMERICTLVARKVYHLQAHANEVKTF